MEYFTVSSRLRPIVFLLIVSIGFTSCYSVRLLSRDGIPEPDLSNESQDFYKNKKVFSIDTTVNLKVSEGSFGLIRNCGPTGFYAVEYRVSLGHALLSGITFGRVRKVKIRYVRLKQDN